jgi:hypothetical protein
VAPASTEVDFFTTFLAGVPAKPEPEYFRRDAAEVGNDFATLRLFRI